MSKTTCPHGQPGGRKKCAPCDSDDSTTKWETKDSGERAEYDSGMVRDSQAGKPRFDLLLPHGVPYRAQFLTRIAELLARGAEKYSDRNWELASGSEELDRFKTSAYRHFMQWITGENDEDHAAAVVFNLLAFETTVWKINNGHKTAKDFNQELRDRVAQANGGWIASDKCSHFGDQVQCSTCFRV